jgi:hypothetical protein
MITAASDPSSATFTPEHGGGRHHNAHNVRLGPERPGQEINSWFIPFAS